MKKRMLICAIALVVAAGTALAQEKGKNEAAGPSAEMMKKWMEVATPGERHKALDQMVGKWDTVMRMWMAGPPGPATESKGASEIKWIMDGRYLLEESSGQVMGMPYRGMGITGYDNFKKRYVVSYVDNMSTCITTGEGNFDQSGKVMTSFGKMDEPMTGEHDKVVKFVTRIISKDKYVFEAYDEVGSPHEFKAFEIIYTRKP